MRGATRRDSILVGAVTRRRVEDLQPPADCRDEESSKYPRMIEFVIELPKTISAKVTVQVPIPKITGQMFRIPEILKL